MTISPKLVKRTLKKTINEISNNHQDFVNNPKKDFCRNRKLPFKKMIYTILSMSSKDLKCELMDFFNMDKNTPTVSAFVQQRNKISSKAFEELFSKFTSSFPPMKLYKGYRLIAVDGSDLHTPTNPQEENCYYPGVNGRKSYNLMHLNAMYDLINNVYTMLLLTHLKSLMKIELLSLWLTEIHLLCLLYILLIEVMNPTTISLIFKNTVNTFSLELRI